MTALGPLLSLATAVFWSVAVVLFKKSGEGISATALNYFKNVLALPLFAVTMLATGDSFWPAAPRGDVALLLASGAIAIGLADSLFFHSLNILGAGRSAIVDCLYSPFVVAFSTLWLREVPTVWHLAGGGLILSGVFLTSLRVPVKHISREQLMVGLGYGAVAMALMAVGIVIVKPILASYSLLWATTARLAGGVLVLSLAALVHPPTRRAFAAAFVPQRSWRYAVPGSILGAYLAMACWVGGFKYTNVSTSAILNQTSALMIVVLAAVFLREPFTVTHALAVSLAFVGSVLVLW